MPSPSALMATHTDEESTLPPSNPIIISTGEVLSLLGALITLKLLHAVAFLFRLDKSRKRPLKSPVVRAIVRREQLIINIFLSVMPEGVFRSPTIPDAIEIAHFPSVDGPADESRTSSDVQRPLIHTSPCVPTGFRLWQCGSSRGVEAFPSSHQLLESGHAASERSSAQRLLCANEDEEQGCLSVSHTDSPNVSQTSVTTLNPEYAAFRAERQRLNPASRPWSVDSVGLPLMNDSYAILILEEVSRSAPSTEGFPGRFSISEGSYGNTLSMTPHCTRGRSVTSVRPFSDL
ncbi:hypothetical protein BDV27DRAFT_166097 [Aspergillus caelatus]|uniref:Uncharacterized protein n=2 Tax=Aspergillus subgen. Circumdati TaxID=2720871 RepID=A0A5N6ZYS6_9EURO|nr:uncharacterized protein BDV27DRAFT_166097 [Aspergillus caelatus]KAE8362575.1 hypothetical protein BDV27DRAFT_166097 [Aspergillus caelatus]KAE8416986.1 hypothetical protein BDV36DRAFT_309724 [Aspergillus pseudocaelatus]